MKKKKKELQQEAAAGSENTQNAAAEVQLQNGNPESSAPAEQNAGGKKKKKPIFKRWWFWVLIIIIVIVVFGSLGGSDEESSSDSSSDASDTSGDDETEFTFESMTVMDNDEVSIVVTDIEESSLWGTLSLNLELENKSDSVTYMVSARDVSVNGIMYDPYYADEVSPGNKAVGSIDFSASTLEEYGLEQITDIEINFYVYDSDTWEYYADETVHIYPYGEENASVFEYEIQDTDEVILDNDDMTVVVTGYNPDGLFGYTINVYVVNKTDSEAMFSIDDAAVNGYMCEPYWADSVNANCSAFDSIYFYTSSLEEIGITDPENEIETIEFVFKAYDSETYDSFGEETVTLNP